MLKMIKDGIDMGMGIASTSIEQVEKFVDQLIEKGQLAKEDRSKIVKVMIDKLEKHEEELKEKINEFVTEAMGNFGYATKKDVKELKETILELENKINKISDSLSIK